jgi:hypothetical protein
MRGLRCGGSGIGPMKRTPESSSHRNAAGTSSHRIRRSASLSREASSPAKPGMSAQWSVGLSSMPRRLWCGVPVTVIEPIDQAVEPPRRSFFSRSSVRAPAARASIAAARPAPPPPTTITSKASLKLPSGTHGLPNAGSLYGVGGNCHVPVEGGRTSASTCTSSTQGRLFLIACCSAPARSSLFVTVTPSAPQARAQAAKSGL